MKIKYRSGFRNIFHQWVNSLFEGNAKIKSQNVIEISVIYRVPVNLTRKTFVEGTPAFFGFLDPCFFQLYDVSQTNGLHPDFQYLLPFRFHFIDALNWFPSSIWKRTSSLFIFRIFYYVSGHSFHCYRLLFSSQELLLLLFPFITF